MWALPPKITSPAASSGAGARPHPCDGARANPVEAVQCLLSPCTWEYLPSGWDQVLSFVQQVRAYFAQSTVPRTRSTAVNRTGELCINASKRSSSAEVGGAKVLD